MVRRGLAGSLAVLLLAGALTGCTKKNDSAQEPPAPSSGAGSPVPSASSRHDIAVQKILAAYEGYHRVYGAAAAIPDPKAADLTKYIGDPLLSQVRLDLQFLATDGLQRQGSPKTSPKVVEVQLDATPPVATIQDCYDQTGSHVVNRNTGKIVDAPGQIPRYVVISQAKYFNEQIGWLIVKGDAERDKPC